MPEIICIVNYLHNRELFTAIHAEANIYLKRTYIVLCYYVYVYVCYTYTYHYSMPQIKCKFKKQCNACGNSLKK